jgi:hypothetical protein
MWHAATLKYSSKQWLMRGSGRMLSLGHAGSAMSLRNAQFGRVSEMKQNPANLATALSIIWRIQSNIIKYRLTSLNDIK